MFLLESLISAIDAAFVFVLRDQDPAEHVSSRAVDPSAGVARILLVGAGGGYAGNRRNPVLPQQLIGIPVFSGQPAHLGIVQRRQPAIADDHMLFAGFGRDRKSGKQQMYMKVAIEQAVLPRPFFLGRAP